MGDPERLLDSTSGSDELERELLGSLRDVSPPPGAKGQAWDGIAVQIAAVAVVGAGTATAQAAAGSAATASHAASAGATASFGAGLQAPATALGFAAKALTTKVVLGVVLGGSTLAAGGWWANHRFVEKPTVAVKFDRRAPAEPAPNVPAAPVDPPTSDPCDSAFPTASCPTVAVPASPDRARRAVDEPRPRNPLGVESRMLTQARAQLRGGDPRAAMSTLERLQARFPSGVLMQEREVLTIQVLADLGDAPAANRKAREFLQAYPSSPHAAQLRRFAGDR